MDPDGRGRREELEGVQRGEDIIRVYCVKGKKNFNKRKRKMKQTLWMPDHKLYLSGVIPVQHISVLQKSIKCCFKIWTKHTWY